MPDDRFQNSTALIPKSLWLPSAFRLTDNDLETVCQLVREFVHAR
jgi:dTDP-4-amino-4,6-dideoxygalactose transaminase